MSVLDLIGLQRIFHDGKEVFRRKNLNFIGGTVTDNPKTDSTDISIGEGGSGGGGAVSSVFGRTGAVMAVVGDYTSSLINNASAVTGATVTIALNSLNAAISSLNTALGGKVSGPTSATDGAMALYSGTTGKLIKNSAFTVDPSGNLSVPALVDGRDISADGAKLDGIPPGGGGGGGPAAPTAAPPAVGASSAIGTAGKYATEDHTHGHGDLAGGTLHASVIAGGAAGFMSGADKTKLDGIPSGGGGPAAPGAAPPDIAAAGATGTAGTYATATHTHGHGAQAGGALHAPVVAGGAAGFITGGDKTKLDSVATGAAAVTSSAPANVTKAAAAAGTAPDAARADHKHDVSTAAPVAVGAANSEGSSPSLARSDHVHDASTKADKLPSIRSSATPTSPQTGDSAGTIRLTAEVATFTIQADATLNLSPGFTTTVVADFNAEVGATVTWDAAVTPIIDLPSYGMFRLNPGAAMTIQKQAANRWLITGGISWRDS